MEINSKDTHNQQTLSSFDDDKLTLFSQKILSNQVSSAPIGENSVSNNIYPNLNNHKDDLTYDTLKCFIEKNVDLTQVILNEVHKPLKFITVNFRNTSNGLYSLKVLKDLITFIWLDLVIHNEQINIIKKVYTEGFKKIDFEIDSLNKILIIKFESKYPIYKNQLQIYFS